MYHVSDSSILIFPVAWGMYNNEYCPNAAHGPGRIDLLDQHSILLK